MLMLILFIVNVTAPIYEIINREVARSARTVEDMKQKTKINVRISTRLKDVSQISNRKEVLLVDVP